MDRSRSPLMLSLFLLTAASLAACGSSRSDASADGAGAVSALAPAAKPGKAECHRWQSCVPANPCHTGWVTGCRAGVPICTDIGGWLSNGTACGADAVCFMGECSPCAAGQACPIPDPYGNPDACRVGAIACGTGLPVCADTGPAPDGTTCAGGGPYVCKGGACTYCMEGMTCTPAEQPCHDGAVTACATTGGTCVDTGAVRPNGWWCGDAVPNGVCREGACVECPYGACAPEGLPCQEGFLSCPGGWPVCQPNAWKPDGTPCDGGVCQAGQCVAPCVPDQPCTPWNACYAGVTVCFGEYGTSCEARDPLPDGTSCGADLVCRAGSCTTCGPGSWCQSPDPCHAGGTLSCETARCEPAPPVMGDGTGCGVGGETCQAGVCTDDADPRLVVRSWNGFADLTGTAWSRCVPLASGTSQRPTFTFAVGARTRSVDVFATPDCAGEPVSHTSDELLVASGGDRYVTWAGGSPPPGVWVWSPTATAAHLTGAEPGGADLKSLYWVDDAVYPRRLFQGDRSQALGVDGYPTLLVPDVNPLTEVVPPCVPDLPCTPYDACRTGVTVCWSEYGGWCEPREPVPDGTACGAGLVCTGGACLACGPTSWCQSPDPCFEQGAVSCETGRCEPQPPARGDGVTCGVGGETCQAAVCTPAAGADPWVRSTSYAVDLAGTSWTVCFGDEPEPGRSRLRIDSYAAGALTMEQVIFTERSDCTGPIDLAAGFTVVATLTSGGDRPAAWAGGWVPPGLPWTPTATGIDVRAEDSPFGPFQFKALVFVHDAATPRQLYLGESKGEDVYPTTLNGSMPMTEAP